ncbi:T9SS type A sorting domain-containing protein [Vitellibacter sp. q18]|nr:T9SS type A sorting domain-containing protein [Aequorivita lutea]
MKISILLFCLFSSALQAQITIDWENSYGDGQGNDHQRTTDGGTVIVGESFVSGSGINVKIIKLNSSGALEWEQIYGGSNHESGQSVLQTADGGYIVASASESSDGDVTGNHGDYDFWLLRLDASGSLLWEKSFGGSGEDYAHEIIPANDGGFLIAGHTFSNNGDVTANNGMGDFWVIKINDGGNLLWQKNYGGSDDDLATGIAATPDGYIIAGQSSSSNGDVSQNNGEADVWTVKINNSGVLQWEKSTGGSLNDFGNAIIVTADGGFAVAGGSNSNDGDISGNHGEVDYLVLKFDSTGTLQWQKSLGGSADEISQNLAQTADGGFIVCGSSRSSDGDVSVYYGTYTAWLIKLNPEGDLSWEKSFGSTVVDFSFAYSVEELLANQFIVAGLRNGMWTMVFHYGALGTETTISKNIALFPNPTNGNFTIELGKEKLDVTVEISNVQGQNISADKYKLVKSINQKINTAAGIYFVKITTHEGSFTFKVVKD